MNCTDPIQTFSRLGYTERESAFLFLVCRVSGYFTRLQFNAFLNRKAGGLAQQFVDKAVSNGHARIIECGQNWHIYHVTAPVLYHRIAQADSTSRRSKGDEEMRRRLILLDCCIRRPRAKILVSQPEKCEFFHEKAGIQKDILPWAETSGSGDALRKLPILIEGGKNEKSGCFLFADPGFVTTKAFERYLQILMPLLRSLGKATLLYAADNVANLEAARAAFDRQLARALPKDAQTLFPLGTDHFISFLASERRWANSDPALSTADVQLLNDGEAIYTAQVHRELRTANTDGPDVVLRKLAAMGFGLRLQVSFVSELVEVPRTLRFRCNRPEPRILQVDMPIGA